MKYKLKKILLLYLLSGMLFVSCSLEEDYATKKRYEEKMKISHVSFGELLKNKKFSTAYSKVLRQQSLTNKTVMEEQYQFTIANKPVKVIETESATSYTILINREIDDVNSFENLIVQQLNSGETTANIIKYVPFQPATIESYFLNGDFNGNRTITPIVYNDNLINSTNKITNICSTVCTTLCYDCNPRYPSEYQTPHTPGEKCPTSTTFTTCSDVCETYDDGGGGIDLTGGGGTGGTTGEVETPPNDSGNNNPIVTAPVLELEEENEENDPCAKLKNGTSSIAYKQKFKALNTRANHLANNETGFAMKEINGNDEYIDLVANGQNELIIPSGSKNITHIHNNLPKISENGNSYDGRVKILSAGDIRTLIKSQINNEDPLDSFVVMASDEGIFAITILEPINTNILSMNAWLDFIVEMKEDEKKIIENENYSPNRRKKELQLLLLNKVKKMGLENKIGLFEGKQINLDNTNINTFAVNWTRKTLSLDNKEIIPTPCN